MPVKPAKLLPKQVLPTNRVDKSPVSEEWRPWAGQIEHGWFSPTTSLQRARTCTHKTTWRAWQSHTNGSSGSWWCN